MTEIPGQHKDSTSNLPEIASVRVTLRGKPQPRRGSGALAVLALALTATGCRDKTPPPDPQQASSPARLASGTECPHYRTPHAVGHLTSHKLGEVSGVVRSHTQDLFWVHNDSGDGARVYALSPTGALLATHELPDTASSRDIEDLAAFDDGGKQWLYLADTGDNFSRRDEGVFIHRFEEPQVATAKRPTHSVAPEVETLHLQYPDGPHDAEALLVTPETGKLTIVTKERHGYARIYTIDDFRDEAVAHFVGTLTPERLGLVLPLITGGDVSADGRWVALRTYDAVYLFERRKGQEVSAALLSRPCRLRAGAEEQGEAIAFFGQAGPPSFLTISEGDGSALFASEPETPPSPLAGPGSP